MDKSKTIYKIAAYFFLALLLFSAGWNAHRWYGSRTSKKQRRVSAHGFRFTSPLLDVELPEGMSVSREPIPFKHKIASFVKEQIDKGMARDIAVYYRDLLDGPWFGINEDLEFNPASMMKVPVMIAWFKRAESDPRALERSFTYTGETDMSSIQDIPKDRTLERGRRYTIETLLYYMMSYSDNNATSLLYTGLDTTELNMVLDETDVDNTVSDEGNSVTVHGYSGFFRILYNASFLNREMSERALALLSLQDFPEGIAAGVPPGTPVAAKYGEHIRTTRPGEKQLHEFGIVYHRSHPYILGIMTRGNDLAKQKIVLAEISRRIYTEVDSAAGRP